MNINYRLLGILCAVLGVALLGVGSLGVLYRSNPMADQARFIQKPDGMTLKQASNYMIPGGFLGGVVSLGLCVFSLRRSKREEDPGEGQASPEPA